MNQSEYTVSSLLELSREYERDLKRNMNEYSKQPNVVSQPGVLLTYYLYPLGEALSLVFPDSLEWRGADLKCLESKDSVSRRWRKEPRSMKMRGHL